MHILVALSGGVDSSVTAALLQEQGHTITAVTLKTFCYAEIVGGPKSCCGLEGVEAARSVARSRGIPHLVFDVSKRFKAEVIDDFVAEYAAGRTPNPCARCNATVKIPDLLERGKVLGCDAVATGHYAQTHLVDGVPALFRGADRLKDQAYFLWAIPAPVLAQLILPLGGMTKPEVREIARRLGLASAEKPESQEICFIPQDDYLAFLRDILPANHPGFRPGVIRDRSGKALGQHNGYLGFTIGQRKGLGGGHGRKLYVKAIRPETREVIAGPPEDLCQSEILIDSLNLMAPEALLRQNVAIQIRHRSKALPAEFIGGENGTLKYRFKDEARAITPGQSAVLFLEDRVLGGGRIIEPPRTS
jgi:tRNA-specific 2-thiouridylase